MVIFSENLYQSCMISSNMVNLNDFQRQVSVGAICFDFECEEV